MADLLFRKYTPADAAVFKALNIEWLETYFEVEEIDKKVLGNPQKYIIDRGGHVFVATLNNQTIGTFAYINSGEAIYEFSKMAISPAFRGKGYGNEMMRFALDFAKDKGWKKVILYSSTTLKNAIYLYHKYGFKAVPLEKNNHYSRSDIKMEISL